MSICIDIALLKMVYSAVPIDAYDLAKMIADGATHEGAVIYPASAS